MKAKKHAKKYDSQKRCQSKKMLAKNYAGRERCQPKKMSVQKDSEKDMTKNDANQKRY